MNVAPGHSTAYNDFKYFVHTLHSLHQPPNVSETSDNYTDTDDSPKRQRMYSVGDVVSGNSIAKVTECLKVQ
jgi:hypothetical protein